ncbi:MAG TPA: DUF6458 family protein [Ilumatobacteraceae bacterium]|nr:DUF6458 family protein [Ilumatobacteraceae bacterium]
MFAALGVILIVAGAVMKWAIKTKADGVDIEMIGTILMVGGALSLVIAAIQGAGWMSSSKTRFVTERHMSDDGQHFVQETRAE